MKNNRKALLLLLCAVLMVGASVFGTLAYLTDTEAVTNTFTVGSIGLKLDEAEVNPDGTQKSEKRVTANDYHLLPGHTYIKDPTVTVEAKSEESYIRMLVTFNFSSQLDTIFPNANLTTIFNNYDSNNWRLNGVKEDETANTRTYEFRYVGEEHKGTKAGTVKKTETEIKLDALFDSFTLPGAITKEQLATLVEKDQTTGEITKKFTISVVAHAIQADGFSTADLAWDAFDKQMTPANPNP